MAALLFLLLWFIYSSVERYYPFHWSEVFKSLHLFNKGLQLTLEISLVSMIMAISLGMIVALGRLAPWTALSDLAAVYVHSLRNLPALVVILLFYFGLGSAFRLERVHIFGTPLEQIYILGTRLDPGLLWGTLALAILESAFIAEIFRAGIQSIHREQMEAARSLGMTYFMAMRYVILPQAFRNIIPPLTGELIALVKESSLLSVLAIPELTLTARQVGYSRFITFEALTVLAVYYLSLTIPLSLLSHYLERRFGLDRDRGRA